MTSKLNRLLKDQSGITALETAIILIAFVVVAAVFSFTILQAGTFSTERGREAIYSGIEQVSSSMEIVGSVKGERNSSTPTEVMTLTFELQAVTAGGGTNMTDTLTSGGAAYNEVIISYGDSDTYVPKLDWQMNWLQRADTDDLLEEGEMVEIVIVLGGSTAANGAAGNAITSLGAGERFLLEIKPPQGAVIPIQRNTPASLDTVMFLNY